MPLEITPPTCRLFHGEPFRLFHGDCFDLLRSLPDASVDLVLCDPPYGTTNLAFDREARKIKFDWPAWWTEVHRVAKPTAIICCFAAQPFTTDLINSNRKFFRYDLCWAKTSPVGFLSANVRPLRSHETMLIFCRQFGPRRVKQGEHLVRQAQSIYNPQFTEGTPYTHHYQAAPATHYSATKALPSRRNEGKRYPTSVLTYGRDVPSTHPTAKPVDLLKYLIRTFSHPGQVVLDPFMGGGSTGRACAAEGRSFIGSELDPVHFGTAQTTIKTVFAPPARS